MATVTKRPATAKRPPKAEAVRPTYLTIDELLADLGVSADRVRLDPPPGTATENDILRIEASEGRLFELVDGILVEKAMSADASLVALALVQTFGLYFGSVNKLGALLGADGFLRISSRFVRAPDVSFTSWDRLPGRKFPRQPVPTLVPDLAVEVLSPKNTRREMERKRGEYFDAGVRLVWIIDPKKQTVEVYTSAEAVTHLSAADSLTGGDVLPGFAVRLADLFADLAVEPPAEPKGKGKGAERPPKKR